MREAAPDSSAKKPSRNLKSSLFPLFCLVVFGAILWIYFAPRRSDPLIQKKRNQEQEVREGKIVQGGRSVDEKRSLGRTPRQFESVRKEIAPVPGNSKKRMERVVDLSHLKGVEAWDDPKFDHCKQLFDPALLKQTTPVHVSAKRDEDGELVYEVKAIGDCIPKDLFDSVDIEIPACEEGVVPRTLEEMSECESVRMTHLQELPKNLSFDAKGKVEYYYFHNPVQNDESEIQDAMDLPKAQNEISQFSPDEILEISHTLRRVPQAQFDERAPLVVCADYEVFSQTLFENLFSIMKDFPEIDLYWVVRPLKNDPKSRNLAFAGAAAASLGFQWEANSLLFDMTNSQSVDDIASALSSLGIESNKLIDAMRSNEIRQKVSNGIRWCEDQGMSSTPTMKFKGQKLVGSRSQEQLRALLTHARESKVRR